MSKRQKLSLFPLEDLPDEVLLKILSYLDIKGVLQCGHLFKRIREISNDKSLWKKLNLTGRKIPFGFIEKAMENGCEYLKLRYASVNGRKKSKLPCSLKFLEISFCDNHEGVLQNCHLLEKLALFGVKLHSSGIEQIVQNGETLRTLSLGPLNLRPELIQKLFTNCHQLTEVNMYCNNYAQICALVKNLTPNILKLSIRNYHVKGEHVAILVQRCKKITELDLGWTDFDSVKIIVEHLNFLEKLKLIIVGGFRLVYQTLLQLNNIETLKVLHCHFSGDPIWIENLKQQLTLLQEKSIPTLNRLHCHFSCDPEEIENLKLQLPHVRINENSSLQIARPEKQGVGRSIDEDWFWEIKANQQDLFPPVDDLITKKNTLEEHLQRSC